MAQPVRKLRSLRDMAKGAQKAEAEKKTDGERKHSLAEMARGKC